MRAADGVYTIISEHLQPPFHGAEWEGASKTTIILVKTESFQLQRFAVQQKTAVTRELYSADTKFAFVCVEQPFAVV